MNYRNLDISERIAEYWKAFKKQPKSRLIAGAIVIAVFIYVVFGGAYGKQYHKDVQREMTIATDQCENSRGAVLRNLRDLKIGTDILEKIPVNGQLPIFKNIKRPSIIFTDTGYGRLDGSGTEKNVYCNYEDPRTGKNYYYRYETGQWVDKVRLRR